MSTNSQSDWKASEGWSFCTCSINIGIPNLLPLYSVNIHVNAISAHIFLKRERNSFYMFSMKMNNDIILMFHLSVALKLVHWFVEHKPRIAHLPYLGQ